MITTEKLDKPNWFAIAFQLEGSIVLMILPRIIIFSGFAATIAFLYTSGFPIYLERMGELTTNVIYNLILGLLIVFRTNTSYDRFWEGRKAWGTLVVNSRTLAREIQIGVAGADAAEKQAAMRLLSAFAIATKLHLRGESINEELKALITPKQVQQLATTDNRPLVILFWIRTYLQQALTAGQISDSRIAEANGMLNNLTEGLSGCERIITTPIPIAYRIFLKRLILIYCLSLPFRFVPELTWGAVPMMAIVSFLLFGVEEVGRELENPFGYQANDLPLNEICSAILSNVETTVALGTQASKQEQDSLVRLL